MRKEYRELESTVYPSTERTLSVIREDDYDGAHVYYAMNCNGFKDGNTEYVGTEQQIRFVKKNNDDSITPGLQSEQLVHILLDRTRKLNDKFPSDQNVKMMKGLQMFLEACKERIEDRIDRGVMGNLKK
jgi:hypothetical protein